MQNDYKKLKSNSYIQGKNVSNIGGKLPPQALEIEEVVIGACMIDREAFILSKRFLTPSDFYKDTHIRIYAAFERLFAKSEAIDIMTVAMELRRTGELEFIGGEITLVRLTNKVNTAENIEYHSAIIVELSRRRSLIKLGTEIVKDSYDDTKNFDRILEDMQSAIFKLSIANIGTQRSTSQIALDTYKQIKASKHKEVIGIPSRYNSENETTGGYKRKTLRVIGARPGMGKSLHMINEAIHMAFKGYKVMIFSLEMSAEEQMSRAISHITQIEYKKIESGKISMEEDSEISSAISRISELCLYIDDSTNVTLLYLTATIRRLKMLNEQVNKNQRGLDVIFIDYLQLMTLDTENRNEGLGKITRALKSLAKELDICIVLYSQLSRSVESRGGDKRPHLSDLRESGEIEQDADVVQFLYRPEYYKVTKDEEGKTTRGLVEIITAKNRQGGLGTSYLKFMPSTSTIKNEDPRQILF